MSTKIHFEITCFERMLVITIENQDDLGKAYDIMYNAYDEWCDGVEQCGDMCCEEYITSCLREAGIKFRGE